MDAQIDPERIEKENRKSRVRSKTAKPSRLINFPFIRRSPKSFPEKATPRILLLQGPVGPFFWKTQDHLNANGFDAWRVCFNAGDRIYRPRRQDTELFRHRSTAGATGSPNCCARTVSTAVVLFGAERLIHRIAIGMRRSGWHPGPVPGGRLYPPRLRDHGTRRQQLALADRGPSCRRQNSARRAGSAQGRCLVRLVQRHGLEGISVFHRPRR